MTPKKEINSNSLHVSLLQLSYIIHSPRHIFLEKTREYLFVLITFCYSDLIPNKSSHPRRELYPICFSFVWLQFQVWDKREVNDVDVSDRILLLDADVRIRWPVPWDRGGKRYFTRRCQNIIHHERKYFALIRRRQNTFAARFINWVFSP